jgi:hypothetical protein
MVTGRHAGTRTAFTRLPWQLVIDDPQPGAVGLPVHAYAGIRPRMPAKRVRPTNDYIFLPMLMS